MNDENEVDRIYTRKETAQRLRVSVRTLARMEQAKKLPPRIRLSDRIYGYRASAIENYLDARTGLVFAATKNSPPQRTGQKENMTT